MTDNMYKHTGNLSRETETIEQKASGNLGGESLMKIDADVIINKWIQMKK